VTLAKPVPIYGSHLAIRRRPRRQKMSATGTVHLASFISDHMEDILAEWEAFARTLSPAADTMDALALRDHARLMLEAIAKDIQTAQTPEQQERKSKGLAPVFRGAATAAASHGALRHSVGFDLRQLVAEFRALRATVLRLWIRHERYGDAQGADEIARFNEAIDQALAESVDSYSQELAHSRDTFLAILGHDLRSPLNALFGVMRILEEPRSEAQRADALAAGTRSVSTMSAMIRDLLEYTRTRLGKGIPIAPAPASLESTCRTALKEVSLAYPQTGFRFEAEGTLDGVFDSGRMHQVVANLLNNAVQHGLRGRPISMIARGDAGTLSLAVTNEATPIAPEQLQVMFDPLVRLSDGRADPARESNLGLGLFIAKEIVVAHGGSIDVTSDAEAGTTFRVRLPRRATASAVAA
jgi:signal transduction histidine kinase